MLACSWPPLLLVLLVGVVPLLLLVLPLHAPCCRVPELLRGASTAAASSSMGDTRLSGIGSALTNGPWLGKLPALDSEPAAP